MNESNDAAAGQYLRFTLAGESYAFDVLKAREVLFLVKITPLPTSLHFLAGVINLRGSVIPIVDLRKKFDLPTAEPTEDTSIVIVEVELQGEKAVLGALVDSVLGVVKLDSAQIEAPPKVGMRLEANLIHAIARLNDSFVVLLDADQVFSARELWLLGDGLKAEQANVFQENP